MRISLACAAHSKYPVIQRDDVSASRYSPFFFFTAWLLALRLHTDENAVRPLRLR